MTDPIEKKDPKGDASGGASTDDPHPLQDFQDKLTKVGAKEKSRGVTKGTTDTLKALGFEGKLEAAVAAIEALRAKDSSSGDLQAKLEAAVAVGADAAAKLKLTNSQLDIVVALQESGINGERVKGAATMVAIELDLLPSDPDSEAITGAVVTLKEQMPELFAAPAKKDGNQESGGPPASIPQILGVGAGAADSRSGTAKAGALAGAMFDRVYAKDIKRNQAAAGLTPTQT